MGNKLKKIILEFVAGILFSLVAYIPISMICLLLVLPIDNVGMAVITLFLAIPLGSIVGILIVERFVFNIKRWNSVALGIAIASGLLGGYLGLVMLENFSDIPLPVIALIVTGLVLAAYNLSLMITSGETSRH
jgi:hypothetical protein